MKKSVILLFLTAILLISFSGMVFGQDAEKNENGRVQSTACRLGNTPN